MCGLGCETDCESARFPSGHEAQTRRRGTAPGVGYPAKERTTVTREALPNERLQVRRPRKVDDAEHIATAKLMKADGDTPDVASVVRGVQRMFASTNGSPWACVVPCQRGRVG